MIIDAAYLKDMQLAFQFEKQKSFVQVASVSQNKFGLMPKARTVLFYFLEQQQCFYFTCSNKTQKWNQLQQLPKITGILFDYVNTIQYRFEADVTLVDAQCDEQKKLFEASWHNIRADLKHVLWQEYLQNEETYELDQVCPNHGLVLVKPYYWDIFNLDVDDFSRSQRTQMVLKNTAWQVSKNTPIIHPLIF